MNKRIPVKKDYFAFLSDISRLWRVKGVRYSIFFVIGVAAIGLIWLLTRQIDMDASTLFGVFVLVAIPCAILAALCFGFEKVTGISCLQGIEWVGKQTLTLFDKGMRHIKHWLGMEVPHEPAAIVTKPIVKATELMASHEEDKANALHIKRDPEFSEFRGVSSDRLVAEEALDIDKLEALGKEGSDAFQETDPSNKPPFSTESLETLLDESSFINAENELFDRDPAPEPQAIKETNIFSEQRHESLAEDQTLSLPDDVNEELEVAEETITQSKNKVDEVYVPIEETDVATLLTSFSGKESLSEWPPKVKGAVVDLEAFAKKKAVDQEEQKVSLSGIAHDEGREAPQESSMLAQAEQAAATVLSSISQKISKPIKPLSELFSQSRQSQYRLPSVDLLQVKVQSVNAYTKDELESMSRTVERVLKDYKVLAEVVGAEPGPVITRFELLLAPGVKVSRVSGLAKDLARELLVTSVRIVEIIEGTPYIGLEIPNNERELVSFREIIISEEFQQAVSPITLALGKDVAGQTVVSDLAKMPHLLVAGTTGSGKSVAINTMILSMLYKATPDQVRMIMIDPKMLELSVYEGIPHLLTPVVTDMKEAQNALRWAVAEMDRRYTLLSKVKVRNLEGFNQKIRDAEARGEVIRDPLFQPVEPLAEGESWPVLSTLPSIVIVIDELADMMMIVGKKVEELIARLAQKARAAGIHLVLATQRPSVDVLTGLIKANVPTRISFQVSSRIDSRTILDQGGAESLLGNGDMLFLPSGRSVPIRSHGAFVGDDEVHAIVDYLKSLGGANYVTGVIKENGGEQTRLFDAPEEENDPLYADAVQFVLDTGRASISIVQRRFKVGYNRAARMIDQMEEEKIVSEPEGNGSRRVINNNERAVSPLIVDLDSDK